jgi:hypothetical protein
VPPVATKVWLYADPIVAVGSGEVVVIASAGLTVNEKGALPTPPTPSVTVTLKFTGPGVVGGAVDVRTPAPVMLNQPGKPVADQVYGSTPPPAANVWE